MTHLQLVNASLCLQQICESNYDKLVTLAPHLPDLEDSALAVVDGKPALRIQLLERPPYTLTIQLTHLYNRDPGATLPVHVRVYLDVKSAEVQLPRPAHHHKPVDHDAPNAHWPEDLRRKWFWNYFLERWLSYCLSSGYRFNRPVVPDPATTTLGQGQAV